MDGVASQVIASNFSLTALTIGAAPSVKELTIALSGKHAREGHVFRMPVWKKATWRPHACWKTCTRPRPNVCSFHVQMQPLTVESSVSCHRIWTNFLKT